MNYIKHHGIKGQKWGVRRFENADGTLTPAGKERYRKSNEISVTEKDFGAGFKQTTFESKGNSKGRSNLDKIATYDDYGNAIEKFDFVGMRALRAYNEKGEKAAKEILSKELADYEYAFGVRKWAENGEQYTTWAMSVLGNKRAYDTYGEEDYSDDQYFYNRK